MSLVEAPSPLNSSLTDNEMSPVHALELIGPSQRSPLGPPRPVTVVSNAVKQDQRLVLDCISGDPAAWAQLYDKFHCRLVSSIRSFLGRAGQDRHLVEEISARVWYALVKNNFELLGRFDQARGCRLSTFLSVIGKSEARVLLRSERRRKTREGVASRRESVNGGVEWNSLLTDEDFLATLSPRERSFYFDILMATSPNTSDESYTQDNQWQLRHRVRKKLEQYFE